MSRQLPAFSVPAPAGAHRRPPAATAADPGARSRAEPGARSGVAARATRTLLGKRLLLKVTDAGLALRFTLAPRGFRPLFERTSQTSRSVQRHATIWRWRCAKDPDTLFFSRRLLMEGETDLGLLVKNTLDAIDWEALGRGLTPSVVLERLRHPAGTHAR